MTFNSYAYILLFLPATVVLFFLLNKVGAIWGKLVLIAAGIIFFACSDVKSLIVLAVSIAVNYCFAVLLKSGLKWRKLFVFVPVAVNIILLLYFKYLGFAVSAINQLFEAQLRIPDIFLPVGISFITFQQIAYIVSVYRKEIEKNSLIDYLTYILFFPKLLMGPLAEPADFLRQINDPALKKVRSENIVYGLKIFSFGLFKKVVLADTFAKGVAWAFSNFNDASSADWILVTLFYTFEIYFDFSGYSDMAVGSALMMNFELPINFDSPYKALSIRDFWKRWHISLTRFLTKYLYIPLGGNRKGKIMTYVNTLIVFLVSGLWHGANFTFILWGLLHGLLCVFDRIAEPLMKKVFEPVRWGLTFLAVNVLWLLFQAGSISQWIAILKNIFSFSNLNISGGLIYEMTVPETGFLESVFHLSYFTDHVRGFWMIVLTIFSFVICLIPENNYRRLKKVSVVIMLMAAICFIWAFLCLSEEFVYVYYVF